MSDIIDRLWESLEPTLYIPKEQFFKNLEGWTVEVTDLGEGGELVVLTNGPELHFQTLGPKRPISRALVKKTLQTVIDQHGFSTTKTPLSDTRQQRFNELIGFVEISRDEFDIHYRIERLRTCQSQP